MGAEFEPIAPIYFFYVPQLTPVKLLLAENTPESLRKAVEALETARRVPSADSPQDRF